MKLTIKQDSHNPTLWRIGHGHHVVKVSSVKRIRDIAEFEYWFAQQWYPLTHKMYLGIDTVWLDMVMDDYIYRDRLPI